jgi:hypothetical protein
VRRANTDDAELVALDEFFMEPTPKRFFDSDGKGQERVAVEVVFRKGMGYFLETALLDARTGNVAKKDGALYSLTEKDQEEFGEMIAAYELRAARRATSATLESEPKKRRPMKRTSATTPRAAPARRRPRHHPPRTTQETKYADDSDSDVDSESADD